jgi:hypothetical protein
MKVFWSWQSDTPGEIGRYLVRDALDAAIKAVRTEADVTEPSEREVRDALHLDHDRKGEPGSPDLTRLILDKIAAAAIVVADVTPEGTVNAAEGEKIKKLINSNVAIELGYALHSLTDRAVVMVLNTHYGSHEELPFNIRHKGGVITFNLKPDAAREEIAKARSQLKGVFVSALKPYVAQAGKDLQALDPFPSIQPEAGFSRWPTFESTFGMRDGLFSSDAPAGDLFMQWLPEMWLRLMPVSGPGRELRISALRDAVRSFELLPMTVLMHGGTTNTFRPQNGAGAYLTSDPPQISQSVVAIFSTGELWATDSALIAAQGSREIIPFVEPFYRKALGRYLDVMAGLGIDGPLRWIAGIRGIRGRPLVYPSTPNTAALSLGGACATDFVFREGVIESRDQAKNALSPFFDELFEQCGISRPKFLDEPTYFRD